MHRVLCARASLALMVLAQLSTNCTSGSTVTNAATPQSRTSSEQRPASRASSGSAQPAGTVALPTLASTAGGHSARGSSRPCPPVGVDVDQLLDECHASASGATERGREAAALSCATRLRDACAQAACCSGEDAKVANAAQLLERYSAAEEGPRELTSVMRAALGSHYAAREEWSQAETQFRAMLEPCSHDHHAEFALPELVRALVMQGRHSELEVWFRQQLSDANHLRLHPRWGELAREWDGIVRWDHCSRLASNNASVECGTCFGALADAHAERYGETALFNATLCLRDAGDMRAARKSLEALQSRFPHSDLTVRARSLLPTNLRPAQDD